MKGTSWPATNSAGELSSTVICGVDSKLALVERPSALDEERKIVADRDIAGQAAASSVHAAEQRSDGYAEYAENLAQRRTRLGERGGDAADLAERRAGGADLYSRAARPRRR